MKQKKLGIKIVKILAFLVGLFLIFLSPLGLSFAGVGFLATTIPGIALIIWSLTGKWRVFK